MRASAVNRWKGNTEQIAWQLDSESLCRTDVHWCHRKWRVSLWEVTAISSASCHSWMSEDNSSVLVMLSTLTVFSNTLHHNAPKEDHTHNRNHKLGCSGDISCCECVTGRLRWIIHEGLTDTWTHLVCSKADVVKCDQQRGRWKLMSQTGCYLSTSIYAQLIGIVWLN